MSDYRWKSTEPVVTPPPPKLLLSDAQLIIFWALACAFGLAVGFFLGISLGDLWLDRRGADGPGDVALGASAAMGSGRSAAA
jgi:hypothetical protein